ncbi:MAG: hypothetical protein NTY19_22965 [Planctomycetota bacterium]|nr:hypothetical protein [Planctomycetota bacterium]
MKSNRTFERIIASLPSEVAQRYGHDPAQADGGIADVLQSAIDRQDWEAVKRVLNQIGISGQQHP